MTRGRRPSSSVAVPDADAPIDVLLHFATGTYFGYDRHGGAEGLAHLAKTAAHRWAQDRQAPDRLGPARAALFHEARRWHHFGTRPHSEAEDYIRALVARVAELSGGHVRRDRGGVGMWLRRAWNRLTARRG